MTPLTHAAAVVPTVNGYTGETTCVVAGRTVTLHDDQAGAAAGRDDRGGWWIARGSHIWADTFPWSGTAEQLLLHHLLDDGATLTEPCTYCGGGDGVVDADDCIVCDGSGLADSRALAEELDRLYGQTT